MLENIYVTIVIIAVLMILDYSLTLKGFKFYKKKYSKFIQAESYELNPLFKDSVNKNKYNIKHFFSIILVILLLYAFHYLSFHGIFMFTPSSFYFLQGMIFSMFICINSRHIQNLMIFNAINKNPSMLSGKLKQSILFSLKASQAQLFSLSLILIIVFLFSPNMFFLGFAVGPLIILYKSHTWIKKSQS